MQEIDIANFAANLLEEDISKGKPVQFRAPLSPDAPDVSDVEVSNDFASTVLSQGHWDKAHVEINESLIQEPSPSPRQSSVSEVKPKEIKEPAFSLNEESLYKRHLLKEYKKKVSDLEELVTEMTTVGMLGVGPGPTATNLSVSKKKKVKKRRNVPSSRFSSLS